MLCPFWAADPKGTMSYRTQGGISVRPSVRTSVRGPAPRGLRAPSPPPPTPQHPILHPPSTQCSTPPSPHPPSPHPPIRPQPPTDGRKFPPVFYRTSSPSGPLPCIWKKDGPGPVMVSSTLCPAVHILGSQNVYSRAEGIADHYWPRAVFFSML